MSCDTDEMATEYARANPTSNSTICGGQRAAHQGHHVSANTELRAGTVKVRRPRRSVVGAQRRTLHGAEHSSMLGRVMASGIATVSAHVQVPSAIVPERGSMFAIRTSARSRSRSSRGWSFAVPLTAAKTRAQLTDS